MRDHMRTELPLAALMMAAQRQRPAAGLIRRKAVTAVRLYLLRHRLLANWLVAIALAMKVLVPSGDMLAASTGSITIELCSGYSPQEMSMAT